MKELVKCRDCGESKRQEDFPTRGKELNRFGKPIYRNYCKVCDTRRRTERNQKKKVQKEATKNTPVEVVNREYQPLDNYGEDGYSVWKEQLGRDLTEEEKVELDACAGEIIITMMDLVFKEEEK